MSHKIVGQYPTKIDGIYVKTQSKKLELMVLDIILCRMPSHKIKICWIMSHKISSLHYLLYRAGLSKRAALALLA